VYFDDMPQTTFSVIPLFDGVAVTRDTTLSEHKVYPNGFVLATFLGRDRQQEGNH